MAPPAKKVKRATKVVVAKPAIESERKVYDLQQIYPGGDIVLQVEDDKDEVTGSFRVSSTVLSLASPVFARMLGPHFKEAETIRRGEPIILHGDRYFAMNIVLHVLHHKEKDFDLLTSPWHLATVAFHCDKYDCATAMKSWVAGRIIPRVLPNAVNKYQFGELPSLIYATMTLEIADLFAHCTAEAVKDGNIAGGSPMHQHSEFTALIPDNVSAFISKLYEEAKSSMREQILEVQAELSEYNDPFHSPEHLCENCEGDWEREDREPWCSAETHKEANSKKCTKHSRVGEMLSNLRHNNLWPDLVTENKMRQDLRRIRGWFRQASENNEHICMRGLYCPLQLVLKTLHHHSEDVLDGVKGLCLKCIKEDQAKCAVGKCACATREAAKSTGKTKK